MKRRLPMHAWLRIGTAGTVLLLSACSSQPPDNLGVGVDGLLSPCPSSPNCVSSDTVGADDSHYITPLVAATDTWQALPSVLTDQAGIEITEQDETYIRAEATTRILRFVDDLEFYFRPEQQLIHVRSASRIGYSDFGVNRERIERIRRQLP